MIKAGVVGVGHLGSIHLKLLIESPYFDVVGCFDNNSKIKDSLKLEVQFFENINNLIDKCEAIFICSVTPTHFKIAKLCLEKNKHVFIEKPITNKVDQAEILVNLIKEKDLIGQVGHVERFNPAFTSVYDTINDPKFIECHRLAQFNPRGNDVSVVLDLMIHDIGIALALVNSPISKVDAIGVRVLSKTEDIANARIVFDNGCVANLSASRVSEKKAREIRVFQDSGYLSLDFMNQKGHFIAKDDGGLSKNIVPVEKGEPLALELESFIRCVNETQTPKTDGSFGKSALEVALTITKQINAAW